MQKTGEMSDGERSSLQQPKAQQ